MSERFYTCDRNEETIHHRDPDIAIEDYLNLLDSETMPKVIDLYVYTSVVVSHELREKCAEAAVEAIVDILDNECLGSFDAEPTANQRRYTALALADSVIKTYKVGAVRPVPEETSIIDVPSWIRKNNPGWLLDDELLRERIEALEKMTVEEFLQSLPKPH